MSKTYLYLLTPKFLLNIFKFCTCKIASKHVYQRTRAIHVFLAHIKIQRNFCATLNQKKCWWVERMKWFRLFPVFSVPFQSWVPAITSCPSFRKKNIAVFENMKLKNLSRETLDLNTVIQSKTLAFCSSEDILCDSSCSSKLTWYICHT